MPSGHDKGESGLGKTHFSLWGWGKCLHILIFSFRLISARDHWKAEAKSFKVLFMCMFWGKFWSFVFCKTIFCVKVQQSTKPFSFDISRLKGLILSLVNNTYQEWPSWCTFASVLSEMMCQSNLDIAATCASVLRWRYVHVRQQIASYAGKCKLDAKGKRILQVLKYEHAQESAS